ncbi:hypothetical protein NMY22_g11809 [Coprinellus aureogranulatus]|nr:hypothetical protein NMY22_g11809 [Coprinellus aureogranulatus]
MSESIPHRTLYFGYGSNLWIDQMNRRCPESKLVGIGLLKDWKWIINNRGYANIILSPTDIVYGLVYEISATDEASLDRSEGVPVSYLKQYHSIEFTPLSVPTHHNHPDVQAPSISSPSLAKEMLVYVDIKRVTPSSPKEEYIYRINKGIVDGVKAGIPMAYFDKYFRPSIPPLPEVYDEPEVKDPFDPQLYRVEA